MYSDAMVSILTRVQGERTVTTQQWRLKKITEPRTLADVPSSRDNPVLFWSANGVLTHGFEDELLGPVRLDRDGESVRLHGLAKDCQLYDQPSRPKTLEEVPDARVIQAYINGTISTCFRAFSVWWQLNKVNYCFIPSDSIPDPKDWQLTDCCVELETVEVEVIG